MDSKAKSAFVEPSEVSHVRRLGIWAALSVTVVIAFVLLLGF